MSDVNYVRNVLIQTGEHSGELIHRLVEVQRELDYIAQTIATVTEGSGNESVQRALATYALAKENISVHVLAVMGQAHEHVQDYYWQL